MNLSLFIAKRYIFSRKRHQVINIISGVAVAGVALAAAAMICTLSVFNGFLGIVEEQFTAIDPDIRIVSAQGKSFNVAFSSLCNILKEVDEITIERGAEEIILTDSTTKGVRRWQHFKAIIDILRKRV